MKSTTSVSNLGIEISELSQKSGNCYDLESDNVNTMVIYENCKEVACMPSCSAELISPCANHGSLSNITGIYHNMFHENSELRRIIYDYEEEEVTKGNLDFPPIVIGDISQGSQIVQNIPVEVIGELSEGVKF